MLSGHIVGRLGRDPELRATQSGTSICDFSVATNSGWGDSERTTWTKVRLFGKKAELAAEWLRKGSLVEAFGELYLDEWQGREGDKRTTLTMDARDFKNHTPRDQDQRDEGRGYQGGYGGRR